MRMLAAPIKGDQPVTSGESGAAPFGTLACIMTMDEYKPLREHLGLDENSQRSSSSPLRETLIPRDTNPSSGAGMTDDLPFSERLHRQETFQLYLTGHPDLLSRQPGA